MLVESLAIVLHKIKYDDKNLIVHVYSRDFGRISYIAAKRKKQGSVHASAFEALSLIRYQAEHKPNRELQRMKECQHLYAFHTLHSGGAPHGICSARDRCRCAHPHS